MKLIEVFYYYIVLYGSDEGLDSSSEGIYNR
jgi:hypothetical protein